MDGDALQQIARECVEELPAASLEYPFGPEWEVFKVRGKVFMLLTEVPGLPIVIVKSDPTEARFLCEEYVDITPGYHMNKKHWITLCPGGSLTRGLVMDCVTDSYRLVVAKLPKSQRPVDPYTFRQG